MSGPNSMAIHPTAAQIFQFEPKAIPSVSKTLIQFNCKAVACTLTMPNQHPKIYMWFSNTSCYVFVIFFPLVILISLLMSTLFYPEQSVELSAICLSPLDIHSSSSFLTSLRISFIPDSSGCMSYTSSESFRLFVFLVQQTDYRGGQVTKAHGVADRANRKQWITWLRCKMSP